MTVAGRKRDDSALLKYRDGLWKGGGGERRRDKSVSFSKSPAGKEWRVSQRSIKPRREKARTGELRAATSEFY